MKLNYIVDQIVPISRAANIYSQHEHMTCPNGLIGYMSWYISPQGLY